MRAQIGVERHQDAGGAEAALQRVMAAERMLQHREPARFGREAFDGAMRRASACTASIRQARAGAPSIWIVQAPQTPCSQPTCVPVAPSSWRRKSVSSMRGSASASTARPLSVKRTRCAGRRSVAALARLLDRGAAHAADEVAAVACGGMQVVARVELPGEGVERVVQRAPSSAGKVARHRPVGDAADGEPHAVLRTRPRRRPRWRSRRAGGRTPERRSRDRAAAGKGTASISSLPSRAVDIMPVKKSARGTCGAAGARTARSSPSSASKNQRDFGARIRMRDRATYRAAAAGLRVTDPGQRRGEKGALAEIGPGHAAPPAGRRRRSGYALRASTPRSAGRCMMSTSDLRPREAHGEHRHQRLSAGERRAHRRRARQGPRALRRAFRRGHSRSAAGFMRHSRTGGRTGLRSGGPPAWRASAVEELPDHDPRRAVEQPAADRGDFAADLGLVVVGDTRAAIGRRRQLDTAGAAAVAERASDDAGQRHRRAADVEVGQLDVGLVATLTGPTPSVTSARKCVFEIFSTRATAGNDRS